MANPWINPKAPISSAVSGGDTASATQYNNLRTDAINQNILPVSMSFCRPFFGFIPSTLVYGGIYTDERDYLIFGYHGVHDRLYVVDLRSGGNYWGLISIPAWGAGNTLCKGAVKLGDYVYIASEAQVKRYDANNISAGGTTMTLPAGTSNSMLCDGTYIYLETSTNVYYKCSISGTELVYEDTITLNASDGYSVYRKAMDGLGNFYALVNNGSNYLYRRYNSDGSVAKTSSSIIGSLSTYGTITFEGVVFYCTLYASDGYDLQCLKFPLQP